jgi:hypothetical protein
MTSSVSSSVIEASSEPPPAAASGAENHCSKVSADAKIFGRRKLSSAHSSVSEFWSGVPVKRIRCAASYCKSVDASLEAAFFMRWPSSMMMYVQRHFLRRSRSFMMSSYVVSTTLKGGSAALSSLPPISCSNRSLRASGEPL